MILLVVFGDSLLDGWAIISG